MARASTEAIIEMLNLDMTHEHAAIIQYLKHAYGIGEGGVACEIEAITRDEMFHWHWLSELVVEMGGSPTVDRAALNLAGSDPTEWMAVDVLTEQEAIDLYYEHIAAIGDPKIERVLRRIIVDEEAHKGKFGKFETELAGELAASSGEQWQLMPVPGQEADRTVAILNQGVRHEYTVILQYLFHSATTSNCEVADEMHWQAVNEMQHMGWLSEEVHGVSAVPDMEHDTVDMSTSTADMLRADISAERAVTMDYKSQILEVRDEDLKKLLGRIADHEVYHDQLFSDLLAEVEAEEGEVGPAPVGPEAQPSKIRTPGSLFGEMQ